VKRDEMIAIVLALCDDNKVITTIRTIITGGVEVLFWYFSLQRDYC
jgi:hypothetical protein